MTQDALFTAPEQGKRVERIEWARRYITDGPIGRKGDIDPYVSETQARGLSDPPGAFYDGGPVLTEPVKRTVVTYTSRWETA